MEIECAEPASLATYRRTRKHPKKAGGVKPHTTDPKKIVPISEAETERMCVLRASFGAETSL